ncbi:hypothetical protein DFH08DRAFT_819796 [Mycena albidolilacea]|uniref:Uncharacterized protein n=1 Tax=Mycena albidolilacea TaxID=1033008 RepID=A0AAD6ZDP3_9AGAR|nr:hypothetical protein DFH08DRAFT_819796 [Mycena albidolilacea]
MPKAMVDSLLAISESVTATRYPDRVKQRAFLDEKTVALEGFSTMIPAIARDKSLYDVFFNMKNLYHQTATGPGGIIGRRYPVILDLCSCIKSERELNHIGLSAATIAAQQAHRTELEDARVAAEEQAAAEAATTVKPKKSKGKKAKKSKAVVEDIDDISVFDDSEFPMTGSGEVDDPMQIDAERVKEGTPSNSHHTTQSLDAHASVSPPNYEGFFKNFAQLLNNAMAILSRTDPESASGPVTADFPVPPPKSVSVNIPMPRGFRRSIRRYAFEQSRLLNSDPAIDLLAAELATNGPSVQKTVAEVHKVLSSNQSDTDSIGSLRLQESKIRSRIGFSNAQLWYLLEHREYLLKDLSRILDVQHQRTPGASSA